MYFFKKPTSENTAKQMKFPTQDVFSKSYQIQSLCNVNTEIIKLTAHEKEQDYVLRRKEF